MMTHIFCQVGEQGVEHILDTVRNKVELQTRGGLAQLNNAFHFFDKVIATVALRP